MNTSYKIDFTRDTITISKEFEEAAAGNTESPEYKLLKQLKSDYPGMTINRKTHRSPKNCNADKGLTYAHMERYINVFKNADELLERFEQVKELSLTQTSPYKYTKSWFLKQFPNYKKLPDFTLIKNNITVMPAPEVDKPKKDKEAAA